MLRFIYLINLQNTGCFSVLTVELCLTYQKRNAEAILFSNIHSLQNSAALRTDFCTGGRKKKQTCCFIELCPGLVPLLHGNCLPEVICYDTSYFVLQCPDLFGMLQATLPSSLVICILCLIFVFISSQKTVWYTNSNCRVNIFFLCICANLQQFICLMQKAILDYFQYQTLIQVIFWMGFN